jgi:tRNA pseudouridine55 synthase
MDGIVVVNKPANITSYDVVRRLKRIFNTKKIGHGGTLDPFATGVLVIAVNQGTKIIHYFINSDKEYIAKLKMGEMTDTHDLTGKVVKQEDKITVSQDRFILVMQSFLGDQDQLPPMYSAKKKDGVKLYEMARKGIEIQRDKAKINIKEIRLLEYSYPFAVIKVSCSKGTYIRALVNDMGLSLGTYAHLVALQRTISGPFDIKRASEIDELAKAKKEGRLSDYVISMNDALNFLPSVTIKNSAQIKVKNGVHINDEDLKPTDKNIKKGIIKIVSEKGELLAIADYFKGNDKQEKGEYKYKRVFNQ